MPSYQLIYSNQRLRPVRRREKIGKSVKDFENQSQKEENSFDMWILKDSLMVYFKR